MSGTEQVVLGAAVAGGVALFILGMNTLSEGLGGMAGDRLRRVMGWASGRPGRGFLLGTAMGFVGHSSAATVSLVGLVSAGVLTLEQAVAPVLGANVGTTFAMQLVSFHVEQYSLLVIACGFLVQMAGPREGIRHSGRAVVGIGLILLGLRTMGEALAPFRDTLTPLLAGLDGSTRVGLLRGIGLSLAVTAVIQSSGATIGMGYALAAAGIVTRFDQLFPVVLGAHIGTCATALLSSLAAGAEARRAASVHLFFNIFNVAVAVALAPLCLHVLPMTSPNLIRQTANAHTAVMLVPALLLLPFAELIARGMRRVVLPRARRPEASHLDFALLAAPEKAVAAVVRELHRAAGLCESGLRLLEAALSGSRTRQALKGVRGMERDIDEIKRAVVGYLERITWHDPTGHQAVMVQRLNRSMAEIERISDHAERMAVLIEAGGRGRREGFDALLREWALALNGAAANVLARVRESLADERGDFHARAEAILSARRHYLQRANRIRHQFHEHVMTKATPARLGFYFGEYITACDRIVRHAQDIAMLERHPDFAMPDGS